MSYQLYVKGIYMYMYVTKLTHLDITPELISGPVITEETKHNFNERRI